MTNKLKVEIDGKVHELDLDKLTELYKSIKSSPGKDDAEKLAEAMLKAPDLSPMTPYPEEPSGPGEHQG